MTKTFDVTIRGPGGPVVVASGVTRAQAAQIRKNRKANGLVQGYVIAHREGTK